MKYLANIGARATNQHLQRSATIRRYPILVAFLKQTLFDLTDIVADLFDANLWERHTDAKAELDQMRLQAARSTNEKLRTYKDVVSIVIDGAVPEVAVRQTIFALLQALNESGTCAVPQDAPTGFVSDAWWEYLLDAKGNLSRRYYELAVLWELRLALRSGDIYVEHARRYADPNTYLIPANIWPSQREEVIRLTHTPANGAERLREREAELRHLAERVERLLAGRDGALRREKGSRFTR